MAKDDDEEIIVPKKSPSPLAKKAASSSRTASPQMRRLMRITCGIGIALGGTITLIGVMALVGLAVDNIWVRLIVGLLLVVGLPAFLADRLLKRSGSNLATKGGLGMVANVFAIVLLAAAIMLVAADAITKSLIRHEGDLYARSGSTTMARFVYFLAGVAPVFPFEKPGASPGGSASGSASTPSPSGRAAPPPPK